MRTSFVTIPMQPYFMQDNMSDTVKKLSIDVNLCESSAFLSEITDHFNDTTPDGQFHIHKLLKRGSEGCIHDAKRRNLSHDSDSSMVVKVMKLPVELGQRARLCSLLKSVRDMKCDHVVSVENFQVTSHNVYVVMEKCDRDLFSFLESATVISEADATLIFVQVMQGLEYCHRRGIAHGDIKLENILLKDDQVKLADFGSNDTQGALKYLSPEGVRRVSNGGSHFAVDIWAAGVTLFTLCSGHYPWNLASSFDKIYCKFLKDPMGFFPCSFSPQLRDLLLSMLSIRPEERPSARECLEHIWCTKTDKMIGNI